MAKARQKTINKKKETGKEIVPVESALVDPRKGKLTETIALINKTYGDGTIVKGDSAKYLEVTRVSSGIFDLDLKIGGGIPEGRIIIFKGEYSSGKSTVALNIAREFQRRDRFTKKAYAELVEGEWNLVDFGEGREPEPMRVAYIDAERAYESGWARAWGVDTEELLIIRPEYAEQAIDCCDLLIRSGEVDLIIVDSVASLTAMEEIDKSAESWQRALGARLMNKALRKWTAAMNAGGMFKAASTVLLINQIRTGFGQGYSYKTSPGGKGLDHFASVVVEFERSDWIKDDRDELIVGLRSGFHVPKNKTAPAMRAGEFSMYFANDRYKSATTDTVKQVLRSAVFWGLVVKNQAWYSVEVEGELLKFQGEDKLVQGLFENTKVVSWLASRVLEYERQWSEMTPPAYRITPDEVQGRTTEKTLPEKVGGAQERKKRKSGK